MKSLLTIIFALLIVNLKSSGQTISIDRLISRIENNQLEGVCHWFWSLENGSKEADTLINLSKKINSELKPIYKQNIIDKLIPLLTNTSKGIIAHYILSNIFTRGNKQSSEYLQDSLLTIRYTYNNLEFYWNKNRFMFADPRRLIENKRNWESRLSIRTSAARYR